MEPQVDASSPREREDGEEPEELGTGSQAGAYRASGSRLWAGSAQGAGGIRGPWVRGQPWLLWPRAHLQERHRDSLDHGEHQSFTSFAFGQPDNQG